MKVLITGHTGFIGGYLCSYLAKFSNIEVFAPKVKLQNIVELNYKPDIIVHLAGLSRPNSSKSSSDWDFYSDNVLGTDKVLKFATKTNSAIIFLSSAGIYKTKLDKDSKISEEDPIGLRGPYQISKLLAEELINSWSIDTGIPRIIFRAFNPYGPNQSKDYLIAYLINRLENNDSVTLASPNSIRDFIHVDDLVRALVAAMITPRRYWELFPNILNLGSGIGWRVKDACNFIREQIASNSSIIETPNDTLDISIANIEKCQKALDWKPQISFEEGIKRLIHDK